MSKKADKAVIKPSTKSSAPSTKMPSVAIPSNVDADFETFLTYFNSDSTFQVSRISFPLKVKETDADFELKEHVIEQATFRRMDFTYDKHDLNREYDQSFTIKKDKATVEIRGIENGIFADYNFEKKNGKWMLITCTDSST
ncbi:DUF4348 domain-containing protein [Desertivirga xinjiangensis]|uniref:DUF4348 domain-containing protein n=1 Tax=Desertivirga xinjiangensis TaxID=539206 RepID=UPI002109C554|nr:DUF4348 domain-containing protein [Pedobacter xinjiangensis]